MVFQRYYITYSNLNSTEIMETMGWLEMAMNNNSVNCLEVQDTTRLMAVAQKHKLQTVTS